MYYTTISPAIWKASGRVSEYACTFAGLATYLFFYNIYVALLNWKMILVLIKTLSITIKGD